MAVTVKVGGKSQSPADWPFTGKTEKKKVYAEHLQEPATVKMEQVSSGTVQKETQNVIHTKLPVEPGEAKVHVLGSRTVNIGDYNSVKLEVALTLSCDPNKIEETYDLITDWVSAKIDEFVGSSKGEEVKKKSYGY